MYYNKNFKNADKKKKNSEFYDTLAVIDTHLSFCSIM